MLTTDGIMAKIILTVPWKRAAPYVAVAVGVLILMALV